MLGPLGVCQGMYWGAGRDYRYPGARRGIEDIRGYWRLLGCVGDVGGHYGDIRGHQGCRGCQGVLGAGRDCRYSGARRGIGGIMGYLGVPRGCWSH